MNTDTNAHEYGIHCSKRPGRIQCMLCIYAKWMHRISFAVRLFGRVARWNVNCLPITFLKFTKHEAWYVHFLAECHLINSPAASPVDCFLRVSLQWWKRKKSWNRSKCCTAKPCMNRINLLTVDGILITRSHPWMHTMGDNNEAFEAYVKEASHTHTHEQTLYVVS